MDQDCFAARRCVPKPDWRGARPFAQAALLTAAILASFASARAEAETDAGKDWPCQQILVSRISLPAVWSGPPIEGLDWRRSPAIADRVALLAARRLPLAEAEQNIRQFAEAFDPSKKADKDAQLVALFAGLFETLNKERAEVIGGLQRFGRKQKDLAERIRASNTAIHAQAPAPEAAAPQVGADAQSLEWDLRIFDERRQALSYVCETPTLIEQRLFALARVIQQNLD